MRIYVYSNESFEIKLFSEQQHLEGRIYMDDEWEFLGCFDLKWVD